MFIKLLGFLYEKFPVPDPFYSLMHREIKKQTIGTGIGTKSQQALKLQQEHNKQERKERNRKKKEAKEQRMFELKQQKKREKHKGH